MHPYLPSCVFSFLDTTSYKHVMQNPRKTLKALNWNYKSFYELSTGVNAEKMLPTQQSVY